MKHPIQLSKLALYLIIKNKELFSYETLQYMSDTNLNTKYLEIKPLIFLSESFNTTKKSHQAFNVCIPIAEFQDENTNHV